MVYEDYAARHLSNEQSWTTSDPHLLRHRFECASECSEAAAVEEDEVRLLMLDEKFAHGGQRSLGGEVHWIALARDFVPQPKSRSDACIRTEARPDGISRRKSS